MLRGFDEWVSREPEWRERECEVADEVRGMTVEEWNALQVDDLICSLSGDGIARVAHVISTDYTPGIGWGRAVAGIVLATGAVAHFVDHHNWRVYSKAVPWQKAPPSDAVRIAQLEANLASAVGYLRPIVCEFHSQSDDACWWLGSVTCGHMRSARAFLASLDAGNDTESGDCIAKLADALTPPCSVCGSKDKASIICASEQGDADHPIPVCAKCLVDHWRKREDAPSSDQEDAVELQFRVERSGGGWTVRDTRTNSASGWFSRYEEAEEDAERANLQAISAEDAPSCAGGDACGPASIGETPDATEATSEAPGGAEVDDVLREEVDVWGGRRAWVWGLTFGQFLALQREGHRPGPDGTERFDPERYALCRLIECVRDSGDLGARPIFKRDRHYDWLRERSAQSIERLLRLSMRLSGELPCEEAQEAPHTTEATNEAPGGAEGPQGLAAIVGQWPGDETDAEIEDALRGLRGLPTADDRALGAKLRSLGEVCRIGRVSPALATMCGARMVDGHRRYGADASDLDLDSETLEELCDAVCYTSFRGRLTRRQVRAVRLLARAARLLGVS